MDNETRERFESVDARTDQLMDGIAQQFEAMRKYMERRFDELIRL